MCKHQHIMSQITFALLKPDLAANPLRVKSVLDLATRNGLSIAAQKSVFWSRTDAEDFYKQHRNRFFYRRLVEYTSSGPMIAILLSGNNSIIKWRNLMGPTKTFQTIFSHSNSLRGEFGLTDTRNSTHGSDSEEAVAEESKILFGKSLEQILNEKPGDKPFNFGDLAELQYWDAFYTTGTSDSIEWFSSFGSIKDYILPSIEKVLLETESTHSVVLDIGCGVSAMGPHIANSLRTSADVYCIDFTLEALQKLRRNIDNNTPFCELTNCFLIKSDVTKNLPFEPSNVCAILDKGCIDSIIRQDGGHQKAVDCISYNLQLLYTDGIFIQVSDEAPDARLDVLNHAIERSQLRCDLTCQQILNSDNNRPLYVYKIKKLCKT